MIAQAKGLFPITMIDKTDTRIGALTSEFEREEFTIDNFEKHCIRVRDFILQKGPRKKISKEDRKILIDNVYRPCFNKLDPIFRTSNFITSIPTNPWNEIKPYWKRKTDPEIKDLFEEYEVERNKWHYIWIEFANKFNRNKKEIANSLEPIFKKFNLLNEDGSFTFGDNTQSIEGWLQNCMDVLFNNEIQDEHELYGVLKNYSTKHWGEKHGKGYEICKKDNPLVFVEIFNAIPEMIKKLNSNYSYQEIDYRRNLLRAKINFLIDALERNL